MTEKKTINDLSELLKQGHVAGQVQRTEIDELGTVYMRSMSGRKRAQVEKMFDDEKNLDIGKIRKETIAATLCNQEGLLIVMSDDKANQVLDLPCKIVEDLFDAAMKVSRLREDKEKPEKNSEKES